MALAQTVAELTAISGRGAGTDAERRAARALAARLRATGRQARLETIWVRPRWALTHAIHALLALAGSLVSVDAPEAGLALVAVAAASLLGDLSGRLFLLRRLTPSRATQNVVSPATGRGPVRLVLTAAVDAPRGGILARVDQALGGRVLAIVGLATVALLALAVVRVAGVDARWVGAAQLLPTIVLLFALAGLADTALAEPVDAPNAATGAAVTLALAETLRASPPRNLSVEVVLAGAGDSGGALGLREYVRARRRALAAEDVAVIHVGPCGRGRPVWWTGDGLLMRLGLHPQLQRLAGEVARDETHLGARAHTGRGATGALAARRARWPAIALGALDDDGAAGLEAGEEPMRRTLELAVALIARLDAEVGRA